MTLPVEIPVVLELSDLSMHFEKKEMSHYDLLAVVSAGMVEKGHFTVSLFEDLNGCHLNDRTVTLGKVDRVLSDRDLMEAAYMAFFVNRLTLKAKPIPIHESL